MQHIKTWQFEEAVHLPLSEQFQTIQNQARLEAIRGKPENPLQTLTLLEVTPSYILLEIFPLCTILYKSIG